MELAMPTFVWLRDLGCVNTQHAVTGRTNGMISLSAEGLQQLLAAKGIIRLLKHYCCHRFDIPAILEPQEGDTINSKRHNWSIVSKILKDALDFDLSWDRRELIINGDVVEIVVLLKQINELVKPYRAQDKVVKSRHKEESIPPVVRETRSRLARPLDVPYEPRNCTIESLSRSQERAWKEKPLKIIRTSPHSSPLRKMQKQQSRSHSPPHGKLR